MLDGDVLVISKCAGLRKLGLVEHGTVCLQEPLEEFGGVRFLEPEVGGQVMLIFSVTDYEVLGCCRNGGVNAPLPSNAIQCIYVYIYICSGEEEGRKEGRTVGETYHWV